MDYCENESIITFDTLYTTNHIQILKILLPYVERKNQKTLAILIKYMEFQYTLQYFSSHPYVLGAAEIPDKQEPEKDGFDFFSLLEQIKAFCSPREKAMLDQISNMRQAMSMYEEVKNMMQLFETMSAGANSDGQNPEDGMSYQEGSSPMDFLKTMLSPEQQAMFEIFQSAVRGGNTENKDKEESADESVRE